jgi:hypothetical protein
MPILILLSRLEMFAKYALRMVCRFLQRLWYTKMISKVLKQDKAFIKLLAITGQSIKR